jgi:hypothetical protein
VTDKRKDAGCGNEIKATARVAEFREETHQNTA